MQNVVSLKVPFQQNSKAARQAALLRSFADHRRGDEDVFWLKENAEALNILECTGARPDVDDLSMYETFYADIERRMEFFPQYYRFLLSLCLDLEDLGMPGDKGTRLAEWVAHEGLPEAELSDLQRGEACRLCARRGVDALPRDRGLGDRLRQFAARSDTFVMPNKKAAYELTHIVFYLSEYGRIDPVMPAAAIDSLIFAGTLAFLDFNVDLLAEICIALRFAGQETPEVWDIWLMQQTRCFDVIGDPDGQVGDDYHEYLMLNWYMSTSDQGGFGAQIPEGRVIFRRMRPQSGPLRELSECMYSMGPDRSANWDAMRDPVAARLSQEANAALVAAEAASDSFGRFFAGFARVGLREVHA